MKIVLRADVSGVGKRGDLLDVADGFARNYLVPGGHAIAATEGIESQAQSMRRSRDLKDARNRESAEAIARKLVPMVIRIPARAGVEGRLFGSVTMQDVVDRRRRAGRRRARPPPPHQRRHDPVRRSARGGRPSPPRGGVPHHRRGRSGGLIGDGERGRRSLAGKYPSQAADGRGSRRAPVGKLLSPGPRPSRGCPQENGLLWGGNQQLLGLAVPRQDGAF